MKNLIISSALSVLMLSSCTTRVVSSEKSYSDDLIKVGKQYSFVSEDGQKQRFTVSQIDEDYIYGKDVNSQEKKSRKIQNQGIILKNRW